MANVGGTLTHPFDPKGVAMYNVVYHVGDAVDIKTRVETGRLELVADALVIHGDGELVVPFADLRSVELFRMHGTGRMLKIVHAGGTLFVSVVRFSLFGQFAVINFFATGELNKALKAAIPAPA